MTVDTSWAVAVFNSADSGHARAWRLYQRMVEEEVAIAFCRPLVQLEFWSALRKLSNQLTPRDVERLVEEAEARLGRQATLKLRTIDRRNRNDVRRHLLEVGERLLFTALRTELDVAQVAMRQRFVTTSRAWIEAYGLDSHDALHVTIAHFVASRAGTVPALATVDRDFDALPTLHLWGRLD